MKISKVAKGVTSIVRKNGNRTDIFHSRHTGLGVSHETPKRASIRTVGTHNGPLRSSPVRVARMKTGGAGGPVVRSSHVSVNTSYATHGAVGGVGAVGAWHARGNRAENKHPRSRNG